MQQNNVAEKKTNSIWTDYIKLKIYKMNNSILIQRTVLVLSLKKTTKDKLVF